MNGSKERLQNKLKRFRHYNIVIGHHAIKRMALRKVEESDIINNLRKPEKLGLYERIDSRFESEEKYKCWFFYGKRLVHIYVFAINSEREEIFVVTAMKNRLDAQRRFEKNAK